MERCGWENRLMAKEPPREATAAEIRDTFIRSDDEPVSLLLSGTELRPGERIDFVLDNQSDQTIAYGLGRGLRDAETGEDVLVGDLFVPAIRLFVNPGNVGECVSLELPNSLRPVATSPTSRRLGAKACVPATSERSSR